MYWELGSLQEFWRETTFPLHVFLMINDADSRPSREVKGSSNIQILSPEIKSRHQNIAYHCITLLGENFDEREKLVRGVTGLGKI